MEEILDFRNQKLENKGDQKIDSGEVEKTVLQNDIEVNKDKSFLREKDNTLENLSLLHGNVEGNFSKEVNALKATITPNEGLLSNLQPNKKDQLYISGRNYDADKVQNMTIGKTGIFGRLTDQDTKNV